MVVSTILGEMLASGKSIEKLPLTSVEPGFYPVPDNKCLQYWAQTEQGTLQNVNFILSYKLEI